MLRNGFKISIYTIFEIIMYLLAFTGILNDNEKYALMLIVAAFLAFRVSWKALKRHVAFNVLAFGFIIVSLMISFHDRGMTKRDPFLANMVFGIIFVEFVLLTEIVSEAKGIDHFFKIASRCALFICIAVDIQIFIGGGKDGGNLIIYFTGTKFSVVYQHMLAIAFGMMARRDSLKNKKSTQYYNSRFWLMAMLLLTLLISFKVNCSTGVVGTIFLLVLAWLISIYPGFFANPITFISIIAISFGFMWGYEAVLNNKQVIMLVTKYLHRSLTLTGRTAIFAAMPNVMRGHWLWGFGYGSTYEICFYKIGYADTQNGLMEWIMQIGLVGTLCLLITLIYAFTKSMKLTKDSRWMWIAAYVYIMIFIGMVETTYSTGFLCMIILIYILGTEEKLPKYI
ncbi:MAG: hypothetical protein ACI4DT_06795 [Chordicoccus sp.]